MFDTLKRVFWFFGIVVFLSAIFLPGYTRIQDLRDKNSDLEAKTRKLKIENALLTEQIRRLEEDPVYQEKMLREKMGIVRKGEVPVKIIPGNSD